MFRVAGSFRGRVVHVEWREPRLGVRLAGDPAAIAEVGQAVYEKRTVEATPTGPSFTAALDPPEVALVTIASVFDPTVETFVDGDVPAVPGLDVPDGAVA